MYSVLQQTLDKKWLFVEAYIPAITLLLIEATRAIQSTSDCLIAQRCPIDKLLLLSGACNFKHLI
jgi:hypothetical protein